MYTQMMTGLFLKDLFQDVDGVTSRLNRRQTSHDVVGLSSPRPCLGYARPPYVCQVYPIMSKPGQRLWSSEFNRPSPDFCDLLPTVC
ncbi:hypothetical protein RRG08_039099 [Elysia crispata]|uniref:Uncharacterized protein n=1 Tax=Elysia crispata TaxID=231223 RepID=A0AAE0ZN73_9GAST|nr:hypothetical protein RRG08_039099 [Elysia crispata]